ncbi:MAG: autotransporter domain-containing protein [Pseudomonadota bacterium]
MSNNLASQHTQHTNHTAPRPLFTSFCIGLASTALAASLLVAPCGVKNAMAATATGLNLSGDVQVNEEGNTIDEMITIKPHNNTFYVGMSVASSNAPTTSPVNLTNKGTITLTNLAGLTGSTCGIYGSQGNELGGTVYITNDGSIWVETTAGATYGIYSFATGPTGSPLKTEIYNSGDITVSTTATGQTAYGIGTSAIENTVSNTGTIKATGAYSASGIYILFFGENSSNLINNTGTIQVFASMDTYGIHVSKTETYNAEVEINNSGDIEATSSAGTAIGIYSSTNGSSSVTIINTGTINASGYSSAHGIQANNTGNSENLIEIENWGDIFVSAEGSENSPTVGIYGISQAQTTTIDNYGTIEVSTEKETTVGILASVNANSVGADHSVTNYGNITVTSDEGTAYGIVVSGNISANTTVSNYGTINVDGATASHELHVQSGTATIGTWTITVRDYLDVDNSSDPFAVAGSGTLDFDDATLIVTPGTAEEGFAFNKEFAIQDMVNVSSGSVTGAVASVETALPFLTAELLHGDVDGTAFENGGNDEDIEQTIIIRTNVTPETSPGHEVETQVNTAMTQNMSMLCSVLSTQLDYDELPESWRAFVIPYYSHSTNYDYGYNTDIMGLALGATRRVNEEFSAGVHLNLATIDQESDTAENDALMAGLGVHAKYHFTDDFHIRGQVTGFVLEGDGEMSMMSAGEKVTSSVNTTSLGMYAAMFAAYDYHANDKHTFTPEVALKYVYAENDGFDSNWRKADGTAANFDISYGDTRFSELYFEASVRWQGDFDLETMENGQHRGTLHPTMRAGVCQALLDAEIESKLSYNGFDMGTTTSKANETSVLFEWGLEWAKGDTTTSLSYIADFGNREESHMALLKIEFEF